MHPSLRRCIPALVLAVGAIGLTAAPSAASEPSPVTITASADTGIMAAAPGRLGGDEDILRVQGAPANKAKEALIRFTVPTGVGALFRTATLRLYYTYPYAWPQGDTRIMAAANNWSESETAWRNRPAAGPQLAEAPNPLGGSGHVMEFDVSSFVSEPGIYSFYVSSTADKVAYFSSLEGPHPPELILAPSGAASAVPHGTVIGSFADVPVPLAQVGLFATSDTSHQHRLGRAVSNATGTYRIPSPVERGEYTLVATADGFVAGSAQVEVTGAPIPATTVTMDPVLRTVTGTVTASRGAPLPGATVSLYPQSDAQHRHRLATTETVDDGSFRLQAPRGTYRLVATDRGHLSKETTVTVGATTVSDIHIWLESPQRHDAILQVDPHRTTPLSMRFGYNDNMTRTTLKFTDPDFEQIVADSGVTTLRFPGGTISDFYDWAHDEFITPAPPAGCHPPASALSAIAQSNADRGTYGYSGFQQMVADTGIAQVLYVANLSTAPDGQDPVDYFLSAMAVRKAAGLDLDVVELGNEVYGAPKGCLNGLIDPTRYMRESKRAARGLRQLFPDVTILVDEAFRGDRSPAAAEPRDAWNRAIAAFPDQSFYDGISVHNYSGFGPTSTLQQSKDRVFATGQRLTASAFSYLRDLFPGKSIWMTEGGLFVNHDSRGQTVLDAMAEVDYAMRWADNPNVRDYIKHSLLHGPNSTFAVVTQMPDGTMVKNVTYYALGIYAKALAASAVSLGSTTAHGDGYLWTEPDGSETFVPYLTLRSYLSTDGHTLYVPFVNKSQAPRSLRVEIADDLAPTQAAMIVTSVSGPLEARNSEMDPDTVRPAHWSVPTHRPGHPPIEITVPAYATGVIAIPVRATR